jgi:hypothetical protein
MLGSGLVINTLSFLFSNTLCFLFFSCKDDKMVEGKFHGNQK